MDAISDFEHDDPTKRYRRRERMTALIIGMSLLMIVGLVVGAALVISANRPEPPEAAPVTYDSYRSAWESAMAKAGVEATFPVDPVVLTDLQASGMHDFEATFTAEELTALLVMFPYEYETDQGVVSLYQPVLGFPAPGVADFTGRLVVDGSRYKATAEAPVTYEGGEIVVSSADAQLEVEGFAVGGEKRDTALGFVEDYLNSLLSRAPRLTVTRAEIVEDGVTVRGTAPVSLSYPSGSGSE